MPDDSPRARVWRWFMFASVALACVAADQATKLWAATALAHPDHPRIGLVTDPSAHASRLDFIASILSVSREEALATTRNHVIRARPVNASPAAIHPFALPHRPAGYIVVTHWLPPLDARRIELDVHRLLEGWLVRALPETPRATVREAVAAELANMTVADLIADACPAISLVQARSLPASSLYAYDRSDFSFAPHLPLIAGELYAVTVSNEEPLPGLLRLTYAENSGAAGGIFAHHPEEWTRVGLAILALMTVVGVLIAVGMWGCRWSPLALTAAGLAVGGALGNAIDRLRLGAVIDFIDVYAGHVHAPTFNMADVFIVVAVLLGVCSLRRAPKS